MKRRPNRFLFSLIFILLLFSENVLSQIYPFNNYSVRQGLINSNVYAMAQDQAGFIWLGTENGLSRFDGINFKNYPLDLLGIKSYISSLLVLDNGEIMFGSGSDGVFVFNPLTEKVRLFSKTPIARSNQIIQYNEVIISLHENRCFNFFSKNSGKMLFMDNILLENCTNKAYSSYLTKSNKLLLGRSDGLYQLQGDKQIKLNIKGLENAPVYSIIEKDQELIVGIEGSIISIQDNRVKDTLYSFNNKKACIRNLSIDKKKNIWFSLWGTQKIFSLYEGKITPISEIANIINGSITGIFCAKDSLMYVSILGSGLYIFNNYHIINYPPSKGVLSSTINKITKTRKGLIILGTQQGLAFLNPNSDKIENFNSNNYSTKYVKYLFTNDNDEILVGITSSDLAYSFKNPTPVHNENTKIIYSHCTAIWADKNHTIAGNWDNMLIQYHSKDFKYVRKKESIIPCLYNINRINCLYNDPYSNFWIGSQKGLCVINNEGEKFFPSGNFQNEEIRQIEYFDQDELMIVSNCGYYILKICPNPQYVRLIKENVILGTNCVSHTGKNEFLVGTSYGLYFINNNEKNLMTIQDGILSENINDIYFEIESSMAWVGTAEGLMQVDLNLLRKETNTPLEIRQVILIREGKQQLPDNPNIFEYDANEFYLKFYAFHYNNPSRIRYQYKTDNGNWNNATSNEIQFTSFSPGNHAILIRAGLIEEGWGPIRSVNFKILPPFYQTWWFYLIETLTGATLIGFGIRFRLKQIRKKQEEEIQIKQKIVELQQKALASNLNPHFVFNSLNAIQHFINCKSAPEANIYLAKFSRLMRMHLNMAEDDTIILQSEIQRLEFYLSLEQLRFDKKLKWEIIIDPLLNPAILEIPNMVIQPFIENSIWHGIMPATYAGYVSLRITAGPDDSIIIVITDNGVGVHYKRKAGITSHNSRGTRLIHERLRLLDPANDNRLTYEELNPGTRVTVVLSSKMYRKTTEEEPVFG